MNYLRSNVASRWVVVYRKDLLLSCRSSPALARQWTATRYLSSGHGPSNNHEPQKHNNANNFDHLPPLESANPDRIRGIQVNPASVGSTVLPGNLVYKTYKWSGNTRKIPLELEHGYFWMLWDLRNTNNKPTLSNETLIPEEDSQLFPILKGLSTLNQENADLPSFFVDKHQDSSGPNCTLVSISFRDSGFKHIPTWTEPFLRAFQNEPKVQSYTVSITERWSLYLLKGFLANVMRRNTPPEQHDTTLLYFGSDVDEFRDVLRMHNIMTNYVFLLDDLGRVRFAGSGPASDDELARLIRFAQELTLTDKRSKKGIKKRRSGPRTQ